MLQDEKILGKLDENRYASILINNRIFTPRDMWVDTARKYCATYTWGGSYTTK
jgi:hypothetical protein